METTQRIIEDTGDICLEILGGKALCRECTIDARGSVPEVDFPVYSSTDPREFSAHILKHISLKQNIPLRLTEVNLWEELLGHGSSPRAAL